MPEAVKSERQPAAGSAAVPLLGFRQVSLGSKPQIVATLQPLAMGLPTWKIIKTWRLAISGRTH